MKEFKIYTCGKMSGIPYEQQIKWRKYIEKCVKDNTLYRDCNVRFIHPPLFYNYEENQHKSEREIFEWELTQVHDCDIVVVNLDQIDTTIGSHMELGTVNAINMFGDKHIFVIGVGKFENLHPWIKESCLRIEDSFEHAAIYICDYLLV